ncbi:cobalamin-binding protein [Herbaspirillum sp. HC18]|nr:cobalamin-binding protein [Herbaspirillum sp. HC18]
MSYRRIVCLSTEAVETLYALGAEDAIAGISGFTTRPARARTEKPKVSGFSSSRIERILAVEPDLVIGFSDMQADICRDLAAAGVEVHLFNQRDVAGIFRMVSVLAALVDKQDAGRRLVAELQARIDAVSELARQWPSRPKVYFEEWNDPLISGIGWVSELIGIAGGNDVFADAAGRPGAKERIIADPMEVVRRSPDIIIGSWCGKKFRPESVYARHGWETVPAVLNGIVAEIKSADILSPGPGAITEGLPQIAALICRWHEKQK